MTNIEIFIKEFAEINFNYMKGAFRENYNKKLNVWSFYSRLDELMLLLSQIKRISIFESYRFCGINYKRVQEILDSLEEEK